MVLTHSVVCCLSLCNARLGLCTPRHEMETCLFLSCALALFFTSSHPHQIFTAVPCATRATNLKTCPDSPWILHHWCNEGMLLCGCIYYYSICIATERHHLRLVLVQMGSKSDCHLSLWKGSWGRGSASCCLPAMLQSEDSPRLLPVVQFLQRECDLQWSGKPFSDGGYFLITSLAAAPLQSNGLSKQSCFFEIFPVLLFTWVIFLR